MSPVNHYCTSQLRQLVYYNLDCNLVKNALFIAGRLHAYEPRASEAAYLMALCNLRLGENKTAYDYSKNYGSRGTHLGCAYVFAQACLHLGKYSEGITALERSKGYWSGKNNWGKHTETRRQHLPDAAAVLYLQGRLFQFHSETNKAIECYAQSLSLNPFMWDAFTGLCDLGANARMDNVFKITPDMVNSLTSSEDQSNTSSEDSVPSSTSQSFGNDPFAISTTRANGEIRPIGSKSALYEKLNGSTSLITPISSSNGFDGFETPPAYGQEKQTVEIKEHILAETGITEPPHAPSRKTRIMGLGTLGMDIGEHAPPPKMKPSISRFRKLNGETDESDSGSHLGLGLDRKRTISGHAAQAPQNPPDPAAPPRRSVRLMNPLSRPQSKLSTAITSAKERELKKAKATGTKGRSNHTTVGRPVSGNRKHEPIEFEAKDIRPQVSTQSTAPSKQVSTEKIKEVESLYSLLDLFKRLGSGYLALCHFRCQDTLSILEKIPQSQRETPWVLSQIGKAYFEQGSYAEAEKVFTRVRTIAPARLEDLELYSTCLWHLKRDVELSFLAHEVMDMDRLSPQTWCIVGNSFSLQRDHEQALKCFKRATQLDPAFAYAFTLQGHEHIASEEYDKAMAAYRSAISADNRHYNAWYGLGRVYEKQGKFEVAESHYRTAAAINPTNAVLICCVGVVLEKMKKIPQALELYTRSSALAPKSSLARYKKARALLALHQLDLALAELNQLKDIAPDEANVHFLLGKVYKMMHHKGNAIKHFTTALNLDPKVSFFWGGAPSCNLFHFIFIFGVFFLGTRLIYFDRRHIISKKLWSKWKMRLTKMSL
jgi:anaphase-promoting complex subunit 3